MAEEVEEVKADLHMHPSFWNTQSGGHVPSLRTIVDSLFDRRIAICAISACHPKAGDIDYSFQDYAQQLPSLASGYDSENHDYRWIKIERKNPEGGQKTLILLNSQEVRASHKGMPADINVIGVKKIIHPEQDIDETAKIALGEGGLAFLCHPNSRCGVGLVNALDVYEDGKVTGIESWNANVPLSENRELAYCLGDEGIEGPAVSDAHHYREAAAAHIKLRAGIMLDFSIEKLGGAISREEYQNHPGQTSAWSKFWHHRRHILCSIPGHLMRNPEFILGVLRKRRE